MFSHVGEIPDGPGSSPYLQRCDLFSSTLKIPFKACKTREFVCHSQLGNFMIDSTRGKGRCSWIVWRPSWWLYVPHPPIPHPSWWQTISIHAIAARVISSAYRPIVINFISAIYWLIVEITRDAALLSRSPRAHAIQMHSKDAQFTNIIDVIRPTPNSMAFAPHCCTYLGTYMFSLALSSAGAVQRMIG
jgi:hypothetical protein